MSILTLHGRFPIWIRHWRVHGPGKLYSNHGGDAPPRINVTLPAMPVPIRHRDREPIDIEQLGGDAPHPAPDRHRVYMERIRQEWAEVLYEGL